MSIKVLLNNNSILVRTLIQTKYKPANLAFYSTSSSLANNDLVKIDDNYENNFLRRIVMVNKRQRNVLGLDMIRNLQRAIDSTNLEKCRVLVISSNCPLVFSSGHNLKEFTSDKGGDFHRQVFAEFTNLCLSLRNLPIPTIAEVYGLAAAAGFQLASSCDLIVASSRASFSTPGVKFGVFCSTPAVPLSRNVSSKISLKMLFTGEAINAHEAYTHGIVSDLVQVPEKFSKEENLVEKRVNEIAKQIESNSRSIVALGKQCFYKQIEKSNLNDAYNIASDAMCDNLKYEDTQSGLKAFAEKRKPTWSHSNKKVE